MQIDRQRFLSLELQKTISSIQREMSSRDDQGLGILEGERHESAEVVNI